MAGAAVAGMLASAFVRIAIAKLGSAIGGQASLLCTFGDDLEEMRGHLDTISAVLVDAERQSVKKELVRLWLKRLKDAALDISDMLEDYQDTSEQANAKMAILSSLPVAYKKIVVANRMKSLREKLRKIVKDIAAFNFDMGSSTNNEQPYDQRETMSHLSEEPIVGRAAEKQEIISLLSARTSTNAEIVIVAIWGLGGMGKSTLAQLVYNDAQFKQYDYRLWVYVSQDFNLIKIGKSMVSQLPTQEGQQNMDTQQAMKQHLDKLLHGKTVLVVLDDLWEENMTELDKLRTMLRVKGSMVDVIVTTRKEDIARKVSTTERPYNLQSLEDDKCWEIIKRSSNFDLKPDQERIEQVGLDIAKKCGGVALAARAVGFMLLYKNDLSGWSEINNNGIWNGSSEDSDVLPSLKLSYEKMTPQLRICFSYCAIFPKGHNIIEDYLIQQWTALDFIEQSKGKECINKLLGMSFLQVSKMPSTSQKHEVRYTMHDLVHELAKLTMADQLKIYDVAPPRKTSANKYFRYSLLKKYDSTTKLKNMPSKMRALHFSDSVQLNIRSDAFSFATWLCILDFSECSGVLLPASIGKLKHLRCLIAPRMQNETLPKCITELSKLQYLNVNQSPQISSLPDSVRKLGCLKYLCLSGCSSISELPQSFGDLKSLVHLDMSGCSGITAVPECIFELSKLQLLNINGSSQISAMPESIGKLGCLQYICLSGCSGISKLPESFGDLKSMMHLDMSGCDGIRELPDTLGNLINLQHLELSGCSSLKALPESLCRLTQLQYLNLSSCSCLQGLPVGIGSLVRIQHLYMSDCEEIRELPGSVMKLKSLLHLDLFGCRGMQRASLACLRGLTALQHLAISGHYSCADLGYLRNLKYLRLNYCWMDCYDFIATLSNLEHLDLTGNFPLAWLPESIGNLKRLHTLNLSYCSQLKSLPECIGNLKSLHTLNISGCRKLRDLPESIGTLGLKSLILEGCSDALLYQASSLVNYLQILPFFKVHADEVNGFSNLHLLEGINVSELRIFSLENVKSLKEATKVKLLDKHNLLELRLAWSTQRGVQFLDDQDLLGELVPPRCLKSICLEGYNCTSFPGWLMCIYSHLPNIVSIQLHVIPTCTKLPPLGQLPHLEKLELWSLSSIKRIDKEICGGKGAFSRLSSFSINYMSGLEEWNTTYSVEDGVEELMFPMLDRLRILSCPRLRLKPCPPTFRECTIGDSNQVISSLEEAVDKISQISLTSSRAIKLDLWMGEDSCQSIRILHHFPALQELIISKYKSTSLPDSMRHLTSLASLTLAYCDSISALPEWLGDLSSLKSLVIDRCSSIKSLPTCIQHLPKLEKIKIITSNQELKEWCESEENKTKLAHINVRFNDED